MTSAQRHAAQRLRRPALIALLTAAAWAVPASAAAAPSRDALTGGGLTPATGGGLTPADFVRHVDNPWFPLTPGTTFVYRGMKDGKSATDIFRVTHRTRIVSGVKCTEVDDTLVLEGRVAEHTLDWYAQDTAGRIWYFGERTREYDARGDVISSEGSWRDGLHGARRGIFMPAHPRVGQTARQEYWKGHAEDHFKVVSLSAHVTVPYGSFAHALRTAEWTPLEPGVRDAKDYVKGIGEVAEITVKGPQESLRLVEVITD